MTTPSTTPTVATTMPSPVGPLTLVASDAGLRSVLWPADDHKVDPGDEVGHAQVVDADDHPILVVARRQLNEYFAGDRTEFDVALDPLGTPFQRSAWTALRSIPYGETISYGEQAERMGDKRKARAVGAANGKNPLSIVVPCHRVVGADGSLTGFAGGVETKAWLLAHESATVGATLALS